MPCYRAPARGAKIRARGLRARWRSFDPGRAKFRSALAATVSLGVVIAIEYAYGLVAGIDTMHAAMLLGGISAMQISGSLMQPQWRQRLRVAAWQPVTAGAGIAISILSVEFGGRVAQLAVFVVVTFLAVAARRFGPHFVALGLVGWVAYFICVFLAPPLIDIPFLLGAEVISACVVFLLSLLLWGNQPAQGLRHALNAWNSQTSLLMGTAARLVDATRRPSRIRLRGRLVSRAIRLTDTALLIEGWLGRMAASDGTGHPSTARDRLLEAQLAIDTLIEAILDSPPEWSETERSDAAALLASLSADDDAAAETRAGGLLAEEATADHADGAPVEKSPLARIAAAVLDLTAARRSRISVQPEPREAGKFSPVVTLVSGGTLPGTASIAAQLRPGGHRVFGRLSLPTRQAIQATLALAIALPIAYWISPVHYTWALVAVFIIYLGPSTRGEIAVKATHRAIGTIAGLLVAIPVSIFTANQPLRVMAIALVACFIGHYLMDVSYAYLMFCITVAVLQLYELMGAFTPQLLALRLTETVLGAVIAVIVAFFVVPIRTRDTTAYLARALFHAVADLLGGLADRLETGTPINAAELSIAIRAIDNHARHHRVAGTPLVWHPRARVDRQARTADLAMLAAQVRQTAAWAASAPDAHEAASSLRALAANAEQLSRPNVVDVDVDGSLGIRGDKHREMHGSLQRLQELLHIPPQKL